MKIAKAIFVFSVIGIFAIPSLALAQTTDQNHSTPGPIHGGMMGTMNHGGFLPPGIMVGNAGEWMVGYQFMFEDMKGNLVGTKPTSTAKILERFAAAPTDMTMRMHMLMAMYAPSNDLTLTAMLPQIEKTMNHASGMGPPFAERTDGIGDLELRALYTFYRSNDLRHRVLLKAGFALPTGSIDENIGGMRLEYPMQLGSGTVSLLPGLLYLGMAEQWSWGLDLGSTVRLGQNSHDYRLGDRYQLSVWMARKLTDWASLSVRADGEKWDNIHGADPLLDRTDEPTKDPRLQGGRRLDLLLGLTLHPTEGVLKGQQFLVEAGAPIYQSLDGPQLKRSSIVRASWQWLF